MGNFIKHLHHVLDSSNSSESLSLKVAHHSSCALECINKAFCVSLNVASEPYLNGGYICELLGTDKYLSSGSFQPSQDFHHYSIPSPCEANPCLNGGTCFALYEVDGYRCMCVETHRGTHCEEAILGFSPEHPANTCRDVLSSTPDALNGTYFLKTENGGVQQTYCHMANIPGCGGGAWTLVMKINGNQMTFHYNSGYWTNKISFNLNGGLSGFDRQETKLPSYWSTPFAKLCVGMMVDGNTRWIAIHRSAPSLHSLLSPDNYISTNLGRAKWKSLIKKSSLQRNCNKEGFNVKTKTSYGPLGVKATAARIGIAGNDLFGCLDSDSRLGFGTKGNGFGQKNGNTCGNEAAEFFPDNGQRHTRAHCYILVQ